MKSDGAVVLKNNDHRINKDSLKNISFEDADAVSLLFLLHGNEPNGLEKVQRALQQSKADPNFWLEHLTVQKDWEEWLLEALILTQNVEMQKHFGYVAKEINRFKNFRSVPTDHVNEILRNLYLMCDHMDCQKTHELLEKMDCSVTRQDFDFLEYHVLYWIKKGFIQTYENQKMGDFTRLLWVLKTMDMDDTPFFRDLSALSSKFDNTDQRGIETKEHESECQNRVKTENAELKLLRSTNGDNLCVIINMEKFFLDLKERKGSQKDVDNLIRTFGGCNFDIAVFKNLYSDKFRETLDLIPKACKNRYKCIVICILTHGNKGEILCFEELAISYEEIKEKICQPELINVCKIVLLQSCRGKMIGLNHTLKSDGHSELQKKLKDIREYENFVFWFSTLDNFVSYRDEELGTWFIQTFCDVLQNEHNDRSLYNIRQIVTKKLEERKGPVKQNNEISISGLADYTFPPFSKDVKFECKSLNI